MKNQMKFYFFCTCDEKIEVDTNEFPTECDCNKCGKSYLISNHEVGNLPNWNSVSIKPIEAKP